MALDDLTRMLSMQILKDMFKSREDIEIDALRLEALRAGRSPTEAYKANIDLIAGDYKSSINLDDLGLRKEELIAYKKDRLMKDKNVLPTTIDLMDNLIADFDKRTTEVTSFNTYIDELANIENNLDTIIKEYMNPNTSSEVKSQAIDKLKKVNISRMDASNKIQSIDRNRYLQDNNLRLLDSDMRMKGAYAIDAIHSQGLMDKHEYGIWQNAIDSDNPEILRQYYLDQSTFKRESAMDMMEGFGVSGTEAIEGFNNWQESIKTGQSKKTQIQMKDDFNFAKNNLYTLKNQMEESMGIGKVNSMWNQLFPDDVPWPTTTPDKTPSPPSKPGDAFPKVELEPVIKELPVSALSAWTSWKAASSRTKNKGMNDFFGRNDIVDKPTSGGGTRSVLEFDASNLLAAYENRARKINIHKELTRDSSVVRDLSRESGIMPKYVVDILEPKRKELAKIKSEYTVDVPKKVHKKRKIKRSNAVIKELAKTSKIKGDYVNFANKVIEQWESLKEDDKAEYDSFEDWVNKTLMGKEVQQAISIIR